MTRFDSGFVRTLVGAVPEERAAQIVSVAMGVAAQRHDDGSASGLYDFNLVDSHGGRVGALEATEVTIELLRSAVAALDRHFPDHVMPAQVLRHKWRVTPSYRTRFKALRQELPPLIAELETADVRRFYWATDLHSSPAVERLWREQGIEAGTRYAPAKAPIIILGRPGDRGVWQEHAAGPASYIQEAVAHEASKPDNLSKLSAADTPGRHLFVWVDPTHYRPWKDLVHGDLPVTSPFLPSTITDVWAATFGPDTSLVVWHATPDAGWVDVADN